MHLRSPRGNQLKIACWRLDGAGRTAVLASFDSGCPALVYFGAALPQSEDCQTIAQFSLPATAGGQLDPLVPITLLPSPHEGWQGNPGIKIPSTPAPVLRLENTEFDGAENSLRFALRGDAHIEIAVRLHAQLGLLEITLDPETADAPWLAAAIPVPSSMDRIIDHSGRWTGEFQRQQTRFVTGRHIRESHEGRSGHAHFPGVIFAADSCDQNSGICLGATMVWSGGHRMVAEQTPDGRRQVQFGFADGLSSYQRRILVGFSDGGFNGLSQAMTAWVSDHLPKSVKRPVHYNCWEAVYFRHSVEELKSIASRAAALGAERFVLDDGWFKGRNDDTTSLGDWTVDPQKYPHGLTPLIDHIQSLGMEFGIWFEPEMVNTDSDLYRAHPDWVLGPTTQPSGRGQFVLDLSKPDVTNYLFDAIAAIVDQYPVSYIKWDHNRILTGGSPAQTIALYGLLARLNKTFPALEIESCASGGGRVDYGMLAHTMRVWLSDSNDALERLRMQHEAARWLPPQVQGSHVGPRICHTSGRILPMAFRGWVAAQRHMGFEMNPLELTDAEAVTLTTITAWYKANRDFMFAAKHFLLDSNDAQVMAEIFVGADQERFILFKGQMGASDQIASKPFSLAGLNAQRRYAIGLLNSDDVPRVLNQNTSTQLAAGDSIVLTGAALMAGALALPNAFPGTMFLIEGTALDD